MAGLKQQEIKRLIHKYVGVKMGDLQDFSFSSLKDFYGLYCDLDINTDDYEGTKRQRFESILQQADPESQAKIIRGTLQMLPPDAKHSLRTQAAYDQFIQIAKRLELRDGVQSPDVFTSEVVRRAIDDAEKLIKVSGATSGVDRIHTALHGYLKDICKKAEIECGDNPTMTVLFKALRGKHPSIGASGPRADDITRVMNSMGTIIDAMNPIRNNASMAHPKELLDEQEAMLVINTARTILHYLDSKLP
jgi:hypothetical protein